MFDALQRKVVFSKLADAVEKLRRYLSTGETSGDKIMGWTVAQWKLWLEGALVAAGGGAAGVVLQKLSEYSACLNQVPPVPCAVDLHGVGVAAAAGALSALLAWLRQNPTDPRRDVPKA